MLQFILNDQNISTDLPAGMTVLDFVRYRENLKGTKIGCREGDCGACTILVGELIGDEVRYRSMTSCLMPLANAGGKHIVTIEGINPTDGSLTPVQKAMVEESGTQCGFCTVGFVMSLTGYCVDRVRRARVSSPHVSKGSSELQDDAISFIDGNICRCTGYKSIERAAAALSVPPASADGLRAAIVKRIVPQYFSTIAERLKQFQISSSQADPRAVAWVPLGVKPPVGGGTDLYVQRPDQMAEIESRPLFDDKGLRGIRDLGDTIEIGASATVTDLLESPVMNAIFPDLHKHLKLVSSTPIRNMATLAGNFVNASPIGDMTVWFLALNATVLISGGNASVNERGEWAPAGTLPDGRVSAREIALAELYLGYKQLAKQPDEIITAIRIRKPGADFYFNFEKVCKRTCLDIATVNTAISLRVESTPGPGWTPPALSVPGAVATGDLSPQRRRDAEIGKPDLVEHVITEAHLSAGGVAPIPLYLKETSSYLIGRKVDAETINKANDIIQAEISPISDVRGTEEYKRLLLRQLFRAHFVELFDTKRGII